jgi:hypothetical protein
LVINRAALDQISMKPCTCAPHNSATGFIIKTEEYGSKERIQLINRGIHISVGS